MGAVDRPRLRRPRPALPPQGLDLGAAQAPPRRLLHAARLPGEERTAASRDDVIAGRRRHGRPCRRWATMSSRSMTPPTATTSSTVAMSSTVMMSDRDDTTVGDVVVVDGVIAGSDVIVRDDINTSRSR